MEPTNLKENEPSLPNKNTKKIEDLEILLSAYRKFAKSKFNSKTFNSPEEIDYHILNLINPPEPSSEILNLYDAFCIYGVKKHKLIAKFEEKNMLEKIAEKIANNEKIHISSHVDLSFVDIKMNNFLEKNQKILDINKKILMDSRDIVYQNNVTMKPIWTRENLTK